jgi:hypothetical protein
MNLFVESLPNLFSKCCLFTGFALIVYYFVFRLLPKADTQSWGETAGTIVKKKTKCKALFFEGNTHRDYVPVDAVATYVLKVKYQYTVAGIEYFSPWRTFDTKGVWASTIPGSTKVHAEILFSYCGIGDQIDVRYDPLKPKRSLVKGRKHEAPKDWIIKLGVVLVFVSLGMLYNGR